MVMHVAARRGWTSNALRMILILFAVSLTISGFGPSASARLGGFEDGRDAATRLDVATTSLRFHPKTHRYKWSFSTFERFRLRNGGSFVLFVDSVGAARWDYRLYVWNDSGSSGIFCDGQLRAGVGGSQRFRPRRWDVKPKSGWCTFKPIRKNKMIQWRVMTVRDVHPPFGHAVDRAPDAGWF
jgi:hypothetical protein